MENEKKNIITEFALSNEENLRLTSQIVSSFDIILEKLIRDFLSKLSESLKDGLGDEWIIYDELSENPLGTNALFITKVKWKELYSIGLAPANQKGRNFYVGVFRTGGNIEEPIKSGIITATLSEKYKKGKREDWWDWWAYVDEAYKNFSSEDTLLSLYHQTEIVEYFKSSLLKIKKIIEPIIDKEIKPYLK